MAIFAMLLLLIIAGMCFYLDRLQRHVAKVTQQRDMALKGWEGAVQVNERYQRYISEGRDLPMRVYLKDGDWPEVIE